MPVIFTNKNTLSATAKKYIVDNKVTTTYVIGGSGVISDSVAAVAKNPSNKLAAALQTYIDEHFL